MAIHPYLFFSGTCREAFVRYQEIFGGELQLMTMTDAPDSENVPADQAHLVMHAALTFGEDLLMASDDPTGDGGPVKGMAVNYTTTDGAEATRVFEALGKGGQVTMPLAETFWSPKFGMCVDEFGVPWMVNVEAPGEVS